LTRAINRPEPETKPAIVNEPEDEKKERTSEEASESASTPATSAEEDDLNPVALNKAFNFAAWSSLTLLLIMIIIIPLPLFFAQTVYGVHGLEAWVVIGIIWCFVSSFTVVLYPLWESREALMQISRGIIKVCDLFRDTRVFADSGFSGYIYERRWKICSTN